MVKGWSAKQRQKLRDDVPVRAFAPRSAPQCLHTGAGNAAACGKGPGAAQISRPQRRDETRYLRPLEESIARGITPAEDCSRDISTSEQLGHPIFDEYAY